MEFPKTAQGQAVLASQHDIENDEHGLTNPNLHRRIRDDIQEEYEVEPEKATVGVYDTIHSTRCVDHITYSDDDDSEIP